MPTFYDEDPRVTEVEPGIYHVHDDPEDLDAAPWIVRPNAAGDRVYIWDPTGPLATDLVVTDDVNEAISGIIGDPLWVAEGTLLGDAAEDDGGIDATEIQWTPQAMAMDLLVQLGMFRPEPEAGPAHRYNLTPDGMELWEQFKAIFEACGDDEAKLAEGEAQARAMLADLNASLAAA